MAVRGGERSVGKHERRGRATCRLIEFDTLLGSPAIANHSGAVRHTTSSPAYCGVAYPDPDCGPGDAESGKR